MKVREIAKISIFCVIFLILFNRIYTILSWKDTAGDFYSSVDSFYELEEDIVDVLYFGSSRCYCSIDPSVMWNEHGIASYSLAISGQDFAGTYYTLKEALKTQKPKVAVVELYGSVFSGYLVEGNLYRTTLPFKISENSYEMVDHLVTDEEKKTDFWFRWPILHTRYAELQMEDFQTDRPVYLGYRASFVTQNIGDIMNNPKGTAQPLPEEREMWLQKIIGLAEESGTELCFFIAPYAVTEEDWKLFNYVEGIAEEHDIPFLNMLELKDELRIDVNEDFSDWAHTNHYGARKVSGYLSDFLAANYDLEDHRGEESYALWDENSFVRGREIEVQELKEFPSVGEY
uniref:hypothetical protein n=1 Tax=Acetatifactor sp. TaxID=1872090 RepID=UPI004055F2B4